MIQSEEYYNGHCVIGGSYKLVSELQCKDSYGMVTTLLCTYVWALTLLVYRRLIGPKLSLFRFHSQGSKGAKLTNLSLLEATCYGRVYTEILLGF